MSKTFRALQGETSGEQNAENSRLRLHEHVQFGSPTSFDQTRTVIGHRTRLKDTSY